MNTKESIRQEFSKIRANISFRSQKDCKIAEKVLKLFSKNLPSGVFSYVSIGSEVNTINIIEQLFPYAKIFVPFVNGANMQTAVLDNLSELDNVDRIGNIYSNDVASQFLTPLPQNSIALVPMLAFSDNLCRLGYGKGYYDRFFEQSNITKIGLAYDEQFCQFIPQESFDVLLDIIVTPTRILRR